MTDAQLHWLAGVLEGEGSFMAGPPSAPHQPRITITMTDRDVIERVAALFGVSYCHCRKDGRNRGWKPYFRAQVKGSHAVALMASMRPIMGSRRQQQIDVAAASYIDRRIQKTA